jgi:hypothetical protein
MLSELTGIPTFAWGVTWIVIAVIFASLFLIVSCSERELAEGAQ